MGVILILGIKLSLLSLFIEIIGIISMVITPSNHNREKVPKPFCLLLEILK